MATEEQTSKGQEEEEEAAGRSILEEFGGDSNRPDFGVFSQIVPGAPPTVADPEAPRPRWEYPVGDPRRWDFGRVQPHTGGARKFETPEVVKEQQRRIGEAIQWRRGISPSRSLAPFSLETGGDSGVEEQESIPHYGQGARPEGWKPSQDEIDRLTEGKNPLLEKREARDLDLVWSAGQAFQARDKGLGHTAKNVGEYLKDRATGNESYIQRLIWSQIPVNSRSIRGEMAVDFAGMYRTTSQIHRALLVDEIEESGNTLSREDFDRELEDRTARSIGEFVNAGSNLHWIDPLNRDITKEILNSWKIKQLFSVLTHSTSYGRLTLGDAPEGLTSRSELYLSGPQIKNESLAYRLARIAPSTWFAPTFDGHAFFTEDWVKAILAGDDITQHIGQASDLLGGSKWSGGAAIGAVIILEPDLFWLIGGPLGKAVKAARLATKSRKMMKAAKLLRGVAPDAYTGKRGLDKIARQLEATDEAILRATETQAALDYAPVGKIEGTPIKSAGAAETVAGRIDAIQAKRDELLAAAVELETKALGEEAVALAATKRAQAAEADLVATTMAMDQIEAQKNNLLMLFGMPEEQAAAIKLRADTPVSEGIAKDLKKGATDAQKEMAALRRNPLIKKVLKDYDKRASELGEIFETLTTGFRGLPEATIPGKKRGTLRSGWDTLSVEGPRKATKVSDTSEPIRIPTYGKKIRVPTKKGGTRVGVVDKIEIRGPDGGRIVKGNTNQIVIRLIDGEEFIHPFRLKGSAAKRIKKKIKEFEEIHKVVSAPEGIVDQLKLLQLQVDGALDYADSVRLGGPTAMKVQAFEDAVKAVTKAEEAYASAAKEAGLAEKTVESAFITWAKKSRTATLAEIRAFEVGRIRKIYGDALNKIADGLERFATRGLEELGVGGAFKSPRALVKGYFAVGELDDAAIKAYGMKVDHAKVWEDYQDLRSAVSTVKPAGEGGRKAAVVEFDIPILMREMEAKAGGAEEVKKFLTSPLGAKTQEFIEDIGWGDGFQPSPIIKAALTPAEAAEVLEELQGFTKVMEANRLYTDDVAFGRLIYDAWDDLGLKAKGGTSGSRFIKNFLGGLRAYGSSFKNVPQRLGKFSEEVEDVFKGMESLLSRGQMELIEIGRMGSLGDTPAERLAYWLDSFATIDLKEGSGRWNLATGNGNPYQKGALQMVADSRLDPLLAAKAAKRGEDAAIRLRKLAEARVLKALRAVAKDPKAELELTEEFLKETADGIGEITGEVVARLTAEKEFGPPPLALQAVSRMWLPRGLGRPIDDDTAAILLGLARSFLKSSNKFGKELNPLGEIIDLGFSEKMRRITFALLNETDSHFDRVHAIASSAFMTAGTLGTIGYKLERAAGTSISADIAMDINRIFEGNMEEVKDAEAAFEALGRMGMPFTQKSWRSRKVEKGGVINADEFRRFIEVGTKKGGSSFVPKNMIDALERRAGDLVKDLQVAAPRSAAEKGKTVVGKWNPFYGSSYLSLWRGSAVTGLILPNPRYWTNNIFGDFSQMWMEEGLARAAGRTFSNVPTNVPWIGRRWQEMNLYMAEQVAGKSGRGEALPGMLTCMFNPALGRVFKGEAGHFFTTNGDPITFNQLRTWSIEDGISESFVREELIDLYSRTSGDFKKMGPEMYDWWQGQIFDHAALVQERQRVGFYADLLQRGVSRKEAARRTKLALYDWSHGIAEWEARTISRIIPFWRFWRLSLKQIHSGFLEPFVSPGGKYAKNALLGNTKLARMRQQLMIWPSLPDFVYQDSAGAGMTDQEKTNMLARQMRPSWTQNRPTPGIVPMDPLRRRQMLQETGVDHTHEMTFLPMTTIPDTFEMATALWTGLALTLEKAGEAITWSLPKVETRSMFGGGRMPGDVAARFMEPLMGGLSPAWESLARLGFSGMNVDLDYELRSSDKKLSPREEQVWKRFAFLRAAMSFDKKTGKYEVSAANHMAYRILPVMPTQVQSWIGAIWANPDWEESYVAGFNTMFRELTGIGKKRTFNISGLVDTRIRAIMEEYQDFVRTHGDILNPYDAPRRKGLPKKIQEEVDRWYEDDE